MTRKAVSLKSNTDAGGIGRLVGTPVMCARANFDREFLRTGWSTEVVRIFPDYSVERRTGLTKSQLLNRILACQRLLGTVSAIGPKMSEFFGNSKIS